jgi:hypothetical protein
MNTNNECSNESAKIKQRKWNFKDIEGRAIQYLVDYPGKRVTDFCKEEEISYGYFTKHCSVKSIMEEVNRLLGNKKKERSKLLNKRLKKEAEQEVLDIKKVCTIILSNVARAAIYLEDNPLNYTSSTEAIKSQNDSIKILLKLIDKELIEINNDKYDDSHALIVERIENLIEFNKNLALQKLQPNNEYLELSNREDHYENHI